MTSFHLKAINLCSPLSPSDFPAVYHSWNLKSFHIRCLVFLCSESKWHVKSGLSRMLLPPPLLLKPCTGRFHPSHLGYYVALKDKSVTGNCFWKWHSTQAAQKAANSENVVVRTLTKENSFCSLETHLAAHHSLFFITALQILVNRATKI